MSDLTTNENQNENKYDLFKGVLLVNNNDVTQYGLIYMSEIEITAKSTINYEDAEKSLKNLASYLGFNCVLNIVRDSYTDSMQTSGTMHTEGRVSSFSNSYSSTSTIDTETKVNNNFRIKGTLAIIGKPNQNGESLKLNAILERANIVYECQGTTQPIYEANCTLEQIEHDGRFIPIIFISIFVAILSAAIVGFSVGFLVFHFLLFCSLGLLFLLAYLPVKIRRNKGIKVLCANELKLKDLAKKYGDEMIAIYKATSKASIKHIGA